MPPKKSQAQEFETICGFNFIVFTYCYGKDVPVRCEFFYNREKASTRIYVHAHGSRVLQLAVRGDAYNLVIDRPELAVRDPESVFPFFQETEMFPVLRHLRNVLQLIDLENEVSIESFCERMQKTKCKMIASM